MKISDKQLEIIRHFFSDKPVLKAYLFGSYARGDADEKSDIDIMVDLDYEKGVGIFEFIGMKLELCDLLGKEVDLVTEQGISKYVKPFVKADKKLFYERKN